ncbi:MAG: hypothetical protein AB7T38_11230 [Nitrospirales bacterium]
MEEEAFRYIFLNPPKRRNSPRSDPLIEDHQIVQRVGATSSHTFSQQDIVFNIEISKFNVTLKDRFNSPFEILPHH